MGLKDDVNFAESALAGGGERGPDFGGMMTVVVDDADTGDPSAQLKAPVNSAELIERRADGIHRNIETNPHSNGRSSV